MCKYFYENYIKAYQSQDIANCKKIGKVLLLELIKQYPANKKLHKEVLKLLAELEALQDTMPLSDDSILEKVKFIVFSYRIS